MFKTVGKQEEMMSLTQRESPKANMVLNRQTLESFSLKSDTGIRHFSAQDSNQWEARKKQKQRDRKGGAKAVIIG